MYLSFDDGPIPGLTPWVIDCLKTYNAKGTFFCVGENILRNPNIFDALLSNGHSVGNHTMRHKNGWKTGTIDYYRDILECQKLTKTRLFRPPYGKLKKHQYQILKNHFKLVYWDVLTEDYNEKRTPQYCAKKVITTAQPGSIIVFHDNIKAEKNLKSALPKVLKHFTDLGFQFKQIPLYMGF